MNAGKGTDSISWIWWIGLNEWMQGQELILFLAVSVSVMNRLEWMNAGTGTDFVSSCFCFCLCQALMNRSGIDCSSCGQKPVLKYVTTWSSRFPTVPFDYKREPLKFHKVSLKKCKTTIPWWDIIISGILLTYSFTSDKHLKSLTQEMQNYSSLMGHSNKRNTSDIFLYIWEKSEKSHSRNAKLQFLDGT
jgi:hypothetical protein